MRPTYQSVLDDLRLLDRLREFHPLVIGTPPLGIEVETSDIDIACSARDLAYFCDIIQDRLGDLLVSCARIEIRSEPAACASLWSHAWEIELFCQALPVEQQWGARHFTIEKRLLHLAPELKARVVRLKRDGVKTEPAFARVLRLEGDPYEALLRLEPLEDIELAALAARAI